MEKTYKRVLDCEVPPEIDSSEALANPEIQKIMGNWQAQMRFTEYFTIE